MFTRNKQKPPIQLLVNKKLHTTRWNAVSKSMRNVLDPQTDDTNSSVAVNPAKTICLLHLRCKKATGKKLIWKSTENETRREGRRGGQVRITTRLQCEVSSTVLARTVRPH